MSDGSCSASIFSARPVEWRIPIGCDFSGFFVEVALGFIPILRSRIAELYLLQTRCDKSFLALLKPSEADAYLAAQIADHDRTRAETAASIVIEHGNPCLMRTFERRPFHVIARVMSEGALPPDQLKCALTADELWVPTSWHVDVFRRQGVPDAMLAVIPEHVDADLFRPRARSEAHSGVRFLSVFKWEHRKGWDVLLSAYWSEFSRHEGSVLRLRSYVPSWEPGPRTVDEWLRRVARSMGASLDALPRVEVVSELSREALAEEYAHSDAFVLPSRGEGWCLPCAEAMSAALPVIATNFSGPAAFMTDANAMPLRVERELPSLQAEPSKEHLRELMRRVAARPDDAARIGRRARADMLERFSATRVGEAISERLTQIVATKEQRPPD